MEISEKVAYLKGLAEGLNLDTDSKEGKLIAAIIDVLDDMAEKFADIEDELCDVEDGLDAVSDDLSDVEETLYFALEDDDEDDEDEDDEDEDDEEEECFMTNCPECEEEVYFDETVLEDGEVVCPNCGAKLEFDLSDLAALIGQTLVDEPPFSVREGEMIRDGFDPEVDRLRSILHGGKSFLAQMEAEEKEKTGIRTLKIGYNKVFGYYIEVSNSFKEQVPDHYIRKQTLVNGERYITQELKDLEHDVLTAKDRDAALEYELFSALRAKLAESVTRVQLAASLIAQLDTLCSFAAVAVKNNYCRPCVDESGVIEIQAGRHPVVEKMRSDALFVPNDTLMGAKEDRISIITGPNMAGKSTYMRQVALIVLMAQVGSFVPAHDAHIGVVDRIFTRIGASDDLSAGQSTFMVEMTEVSDILRTATKNSLLILDEIGRGTSTFDGMSIARAVLEHCAERLKAKTLFATHYHELTALEQTLPNVRNYNIAVRARGEDIIFLRKIIPGGADRSYGIEVAKLAGLPDSVLKRARAILEELESQSGRPAPVAAPDDQLSLTAMAESEVAELLRRTQVDSLSPLEALNLLYDLKKRLGNG